MAVIGGNVCGNWVCRDSVTSREDNTKEICST